MEATKENKIIGIGSIITIHDFDFDEDNTYTIVSAKTGQDNELAYDCDLGKSIIGKTVGDKVTVKANEEYEIEVLSVDNSNITEVETYRSTFFCFQGKEWQNELSQGYIFALSDGISHHERLRDVRKGDIIFHGGMQGILAISVAEGQYTLEDFPKCHYLAEELKDKKGLMVHTKYYILEHPIITYEYIEDIKRLQGNHDGKGYPFNKNGKGNEGYLFNLNINLARFFMEEILQRNQFLNSEDFVQDLLK